MYEHESITLTLDQQEFMDQCSEFVRTKMKGATTEIGFGGKSTRGYRYSDFVMTITANKSKDSFEVTRNRDGMLVLAVYSGSAHSINWEFIFIQEHLKGLLAA